MVASMPVGRRLRCRGRHRQSRSCGQTEGVKLRFCRWARRARKVELASAAKTSKSRRTISARQPVSIVDTTLWTLARLIGVNDVSVLTSIRCLNVVARWPRILRPHHFGATVGTFLGPNQGVFHGTCQTRLRYAAPNIRTHRDRAMHSSVRRRVSNAVHKPDAPAGCR
jgi:hypothetical protein